MEKLAWIISGLLFLSILIGLVVWSQTQPKLPVASQVDLRVNLQPGSAHAVASQLNTYQRRVLKLSQGMVTSANATDDQNRIIYTIRTTNVSTELINFGLKHEQAQVQKLTDKVLGHAGWWGNAAWIRNSNSKSVWGCIEDIKNRMRKPIAQTMR